MRTDDKERMHFSAQVAGIDYATAELRITALLIAQRDRFEQAFAAEGLGTVESLQTCRDPYTQFAYKPELTFLRGAWHGWKLRERLTGNDPFMGFLLEGANEGEFAAHDDACLGLMGAMERILDGKDDGSGSCSGQWGLIRARVLKLVKEHYCLKMVGWRWRMEGGDWVSGVYPLPLPSEDSIARAQRSSFGKPITIDYVYSKT